jgi:hypothetical protein
MHDHKRKREASEAPALETVAPPTIPRKKEKTVSVKKENLNVSLYMEEGELEKPN